MYLIPLQFKIWELGNYLFARSKKLSMESKRQKQVSEIVRRHFSTMLQQEGANIYGSSVLVTVTNVVMAPDLKLAKIYLSIYNTENKQEVILLMEKEHQKLKQAFYHRIRKHLRRMPDFDVYLDDTLDEMYRLNELFHDLNTNNQMGKKEEEE